MRKKAHCWDVSGVKYRFVLREIAIYLCIRELQPKYIKDKEFPICSTNFFGMDSLTCNDEVVVGRKGNLGNTDFIENQGDAVNAHACVLEFFKEKEFVISIIQDVISAGLHSEVGECRKKLMSVMKVVEKYREDPSLLDPHVVAIIRPIFYSIFLPHLENMRENTCWTPVMSLLCSLVYTISSVCGYSSLTMNEVFPHDVFLLRRVLDVLDSISDSWESRFVLTLWLSVLVRSPFSFESIGVPHNRIVELAVRQITNESCNRSILKATSLVLARMFLRTDSGDNWLAEIASRLPEAPLLEVLHRTLKLSSRRLSESELSLVVNRISTCSSDPRSRKLRIGILGFLTSSASSLDLAEDAINYIIESFSHKDGAVRYSAAKAIAHIIRSRSRLYGIQIYDYLMSLQLRDDFEYHSLSMALGEMVRRPDVTGLVSIEAVVHVAIEALEKERNTLSMTQQIRDSGCALVWFLSRQLSPDRLLSEVIEHCVCPLINVAFFDRDINLRRAASAALQELVGRVGSDRFPEGLLLITVIDFFSVSNLDECYTILPQRAVSTLPLEGKWRRKILESISNHLLKEKIFKSTSILTTLASRRIQLLAAHALAILDRGPDLVESMCEIATSTDAEWHERLAAISFISHHTTTCLSLTILPEQHQSLIRNLVPVIERKRLYRGKGGDLIRSACYNLLAAIYHSTIQFKDNEKYFSKICEMLSEGIVHLVEHVQGSAISALVSIAGTDRAYSLSSLVQGFLQRLREPRGVNVAARRGMVLAIGLVAANDCDVFDLLTNEALSWPKHWLGNHDYVDPQCRMNAILGLAKIGSDGVDRAAQVCIDAMDDFHSDKRGDVGSWVRSRAIDTFISLYERCGIETRRKIFFCVATHCGERLDKIRDKCWSILAGTELDDLEIPVAADPFELVCQLVVNGSAELSQLVVAVGGSTPNSVAEKALLALAGNLNSSSLISDQLFELLSSKNRYQSKTDYTNRVFVPVVNCIALLVSRSHLSLSADVIIKRIHEPLICAEDCSSLNALKAVSKLYVWFVEASTILSDFFVNGILLSGIPKLRHFAVSELISVLLHRGNSDVVIDQIDSVDWLSENEQDWMRSGVEVIAGHLDIHINTRTKTNHSSAVVEKDKTGYSDFIKENYRYS